MYNIRQYNRMLQAISDYENQHLTLNSLIANLEGLVGALQEVPVEWTDLFRQKWGLLDDVYAEMVYTEQTQMDGFLAQLVSEALRELKLQIEEKLQQERNRGAD